VPQPESNGLTAISRANCLSVASFRTADVNLFGAGYPAQQGKASGVFLCLLSFAQAKKVRRRAGAQPRGFDWFVLLVVKDKTNTGGSRPARRLTFFNVKKVSKKTGSPSGGHIPSPGFGGFYSLRSMGSGPIQGGLSTQLS